MYKGRLDLLHMIHQYNRETLHDQVSAPETTTLILCPSYQSIPGERVAKASRFGNPLGDGKAQAGKGK
jgi:hypothetical protein